MGPLLQTLLDNIEDTLQGTSSQPNRLDASGQTHLFLHKLYSGSKQSLSHRKLFLYSAHDTTLIPCLMALGVFDMRWPPYAADITLELHQKKQTNEAFVKVSYVGQVWGENLFSWMFFFFVPSVQV